MLVNAIGTVRTPFRSPTGTPIQPLYGRDLEGTVELSPEHEAALADIEGFERLWLIYWMDRAGPFTPLVVPYRDDARHGLFATRAPARPNPIGLSVVRLLERRGHILRIADIDILDGTLLLDIKPYVPAFDAHPASRAGWFDRTGSDRTLADQRFHERTD
jgi:tRNA-Thr(GGU) m(6)t(6)A37 methyltransferase TsaA